MSIELNIFSSSLFVPSSLPEIFTKIKNNEHLIQWNNPNLRRLASVQILAEDKKSVSYLMFIRIAVSVLFT